MPATSNTQGVMAMQFLMKAGLMLGVWFAIEYLITVFATQSILLAIVHTGAMCATVFFLFYGVYKLRQTVFPNGFLYLQAWLYGTELMFFGGLIEAIFIYAYNQWLAPNTQLQMRNALVAQYENVQQQMEALGNTSNAFIEKWQQVMEQSLELIKTAPIERPIDLALTAISNDIFYGMIWMILFSFFLRKKFGNTNLQS